MSIKNPRTLRAEKGRHVVFNVLISLGLVLLFLYNPPVLSDLAGGLLYDLHFRIRQILKPLNPPKEILIVAIDEKSLSEYGRWPWSRLLQAELIQEVLEGRPEAVGLDILYPEPESPEADRRLAKVLARGKEKIVLALGFDVTGGRRYEGEVDGRILDDAINRISAYSRVRAPEAWRALIPPDPIGKVATFGHVYSLPDRDGVRRREYLYIGYGGEYFPSFALKMAAVIRGRDIKIIGDEGASLGKKIIPADRFGRMLINYYGREGTFRYISAADLLSGRTGSRTFRNSYVLIGTSAIATYDLVITPLSANMPGVEKNATVLGNILRGEYLSQAPRFLILLLLLCSLTAGWVIRRLPAIRGILLFSGSLMLLLIISLSVFIFLRLYIDMLYPVLALITGGGYNLAVKLLVVERKGKEIRKIFANYVSPKIVERLIEEPELLRLGGERRTVTVLFSDIRDFTGMSEKVSPERVISILNRYFSVVTEVILKYDGTIDKFVGDEVMAFWGAPLRQERHAELALSAAIEIKRRLTRLSEEISQSGDMVSLDAGVGISTGEVVVGNIGVEGRKMDYTVIGDAVNLGSRLEALTREYDSDIMISERTFHSLSPEYLAGLGQLIDIEEFTDVKVKGKTDSVSIYIVRLLRERP